jgi:hypothetical protein
MKTITQRRLLALILLFVAVLFPLFQASSVVFSSAYYIASRQHEAS